MVSHPPEKSTNFDDLPPLPEESREPTGKGNGDEPPALADALREALLQVHEWQAAEEKAPAAGPSVIFKDDHPTTARAFLRWLGSPVITHAGDSYQYNGRNYARLPAGDLEALLWQWAEAAMDGATRQKFNPTRNWGLNVTTAIRALSFVPESKSPPCDLAEESPLPADLILPCRNGLLYLPYRELLPHSPRFFAMTCLPYDFDPAARAPALEAFLDSIWPDDQQSRETLQEIIGYLVVGANDLHKAFLIVGAKRAGKGTICRLIRELMGPEAVAAPTLRTLGEHFGRECLIHKKAAIIGDARFDGKTDKSAVAEVLLSVSGGDPCDIPRKHRTDWHGILGARFVLVSNEVPRLADVSGALPSRFITLFMPKSFYGKEDPSLQGKLSAELSGILNWALDGYDRLRKRGYFVQPETGKARHEEMEEFSSPVLTFLRDCCLVAPGAQVSVDEIYLAWCEWCRDQGRTQTGTKQTFGAQLMAAKPEITRTQPRTEGKRIRHYSGIGLICESGTHWHAPGTDGEAPQVVENKENFESGTHWHAPKRNCSSNSKVEDTNRKERVPPRASDPVTCGTCRNYKPNSQNPEAGMGSCFLGQRVPATWPNASRFCRDFEPTF